MRNLAAFSQKRSISLSRGRTVLLLSLALLGGTPFAVLESRAQSSRTPSGAPSQKRTQELLPLPRRNPILLQYPPPEIDIPYTEEQLKAILRQRPNDFIAHFYLMCLYAQQHKWENSLKHALRAREIDKSDINVHMGIVYCYANLGRWREAEAAVQKALKQSWDTLGRSALLRLRGDIFMDRYRATEKTQWLEKALADYQQALKLDSANIQAQVGVARVMISRKQYAEAKRRLQKALPQVDLSAPGGRRKKALVLYYLGVIEEIQGRTQQAEKLYQEAVKTHPQSFLPMREGELLMLLMVGLKAIQEYQLDKKTLKRHIRR